MGLYGKNGYYFYVKLEEGQGFIPNEVMTLYNTDANGNPTTRFQSDKISRYMCVRYLETDNPIYNKVEFVAIKEANETESRLSPATPLFDYQQNGAIADPFTTNLVLVGEHTGTVAFLRGPGYGGKIWTEPQIYQGVRNVAIGEIDYDPQRHDLFNWVGDDRIYIRTNQNGVTTSPINQDFYDGTPFSPSQMNYSCLPIVGRFPDQPTPYMGTTSVGSCLISRQHLVAAAHYWNGTGQSLSFYDPTTNQYYTRTVVGSAGYDVPNISPQFGYPTTLVEMALYLGVPFPNLYPPIGPDVWWNSLLISSIGADFNSSLSAKMFGDLELLLLDSPLPDGVKPASLPIVPKTSRTSRVGCGINIDANQRGYVFNVDSSREFSPVENSPVLKTYIGKNITTPLISNDYLLRSYPEGVSENDTQNLQYVGDSSSVTLARYGEKTLLFGVTTNGNTSGRAKVVSIQNGLVVNPSDAFDNTELFGATIFSGVSTWLADFVSLPYGDIPNSYYREPSSMAGIAYLEGVYGVGNIPSSVMTPEYIDFIKNTPVVSGSSIPSILRDVPSLVTQFINKWSRDTLGSSYQDVTLDWFTIPDDCPYEPCYQFSYDREVVPQRKAELPFWRAPLEREGRSGVPVVRPPSIPPLPTTYQVRNAQGVTLA
jgi:hypothetical protein